MEATPPQSVFKLRPPKLAMSRSPFAFLRRFTSPAIIAALLCLPSFRLDAQVPQLINYQGRVAVGTVNFNGTGQFKFALVNSTGSTTYWSNDGTSTAGSQPTAAVSLTVTKGLYSVLLGDTSLTNMTAVPNSVFANADVRLRVWFNDGSNGSQLLTPDQRLAAVGYAMVAGGVNLPATSSSTTGVIAQNGSPLMHTFGTSNFFAGSGAGNFTLTGSFNTGGGYTALSSNTTGTNNTASGAFSLLNNTTGSNNTASGQGSLCTNSTGSNNTASGNNALLTNMTGGNNTAIGASALMNNQTGSGNTASGSQTLQANTTGADNLAGGFAALKNNTTASQNVALGNSALFTQSFNNGGGAWASNNVGVGYQALRLNQPTSTSTGVSNTAIGANALQSNTTGANNIAVGFNAGSGLTTGSNNIDIGHTGAAGESNTIRVGAAGTQTSAFVAGVRGVTTGVNDAVNVMIDSNGQLGTISSSQRYKEDIADMGDASDRIQSLRPVTFRYKKPYRNGEKPVQFGLIAEEVAKVFPELAVLNDEGQPETVKYQDLTPLLLNEVQKLRSEKETMKKESADLRARLEKLEALILKGEAK